MVREGEFLQLLLEFQQQAVNVHAMQFITVVSVLQYVVSTLISRCC